MIYTTKYEIDKKYGIKRRRAGLSSRIRPSTPFIGGDGRRLADYCRRRIASNGIH